MSKLTRRVAEIAFLIELTVIATFAGGMTLFIILPYLSTLEARHFPVKTDWHVDSYSIDGNDIVMSGTVIKRRPCTWIGTTSAQDDTGRYFVVIPESLNTNQLSWPASETPHEWGPWRIVGGAGRKLTLRQSHRCHFFWPSEAVLGTFDSSRAR